MVYVLIDFRKKSDSEDFMYVLIKPLTDERSRDIIVNYNHLEDERFKEKVKSLPLKA
jgi:hypothetical protein